MWPAASDQARTLGDLLEHEVLVAHHRHRQGASAEGAERRGHPLGVVADRVRHDLAADVALFSVDDPLAPLARHAGRGAEAVDPCAQAARPPPPAPAPASAAPGHDAPAPDPPSAVELRARPAALRPGRQSRAEWARPRGRQPEAHHRRRLDEPARPDRAGGHRAASRPAPARPRAGLHVHPSGRCHRAGHPEPVLALGRPEPCWEDGGNPSGAAQLLRP